jgi:hypothetical protein
VAVVVYRRAAVAGYRLVAVAAVVHPLVAAAMGIYHRSAAVQSAHRRTPGVERPRLAVVTLSVEPSVVELWVHPPEVCR